MPRRRLVDQIAGPDADRVQRIEQAEISQFLYREGQGVDPDAELLDLGGLLSDDGLYATRMKGERRRQPANSAPDNEYPHENLRLLVFSLRVRLLERQALRDTS